MPRADHGTSFKSGQEPEERALRDVLAVAADDRGGGDDAAPGGREDFHREDEREERQADRAAEAEAAAQREGEEQHRDAVGELEGREVLDQDGSPLPEQLQQMRGLGGRTPAGRNPSANQAVVLRFAPGGAWTR